MSNREESVRASRCTRVDQIAPKRDGLLSKGLKRTALSVAISMCLMTNANAQSAVGSLYGQADTGSTVTITDTGTGLSRTATVGSNGQFTFSGLPTGTYRVSVERDGKQVASDQVRVAAGAGTPVTFDLETIVVSSTRVSAIDVSTSQVSTTFTAEQLQDLPIAPNVTAIALLAPGTVRGDTLLGGEGLGNGANLASFGGSSVAENAYYINGFNVTNLFKNLSYSQVPFYAIDTQQVLTGGYGPQYGMSTGGVVSVTTRKGTNEFEVGAAMSWSPDSLQEDSPRTYTPQLEAYRDYSGNERTETIYDLWVGGPIIRDKLFFFAIGELTERERVNFPNSYYASANVQHQDSEAPFWLTNVTWNITDNHILDFTAMDDTRKYTTAQFSNEFDAKGFVIGGGDYVGTQYEKFGGRTYIGTYRGQITDDLALTVTYGDLTSKRETYQRSANGDLVIYNGVVGDFDQPGCPYINDSLIEEDIPSCHLGLTVPSATAEDSRKNGRIDVSYTLDTGAAGLHTLQVGYEQDEWRSFDGESYSGGASYLYQVDPTTGAQFVRVRHFQTGADVGVDTKSLYISDDWKVLDNLLLTIGVRNDSFENLNGAGEAYAKQDDIWQPRFGFAWDVTGDSTKKLYGSFGIYSLPIAATVAVRGASASLFDTQFWNYDGYDPVTGRPNLTTPRAPLGYLNGEDGSTPNPNWVASNNLDPTIQEEFILGYQAEVAPHWTAGIKGTYRNLKSTIDDMCDTRPFEAWAEQNLGGEYDPADGTPGCFMFNPGEAMTFANMDLNNDGVLEDVTLTPEMIGSPEAKRKYYSVELSLEKSMSDNWYMRATYLWAKSYGNAEGLVNSDIGQDDTGVTIAFDFPELMTYANGYLPNDRRHTVKLLGAYQATEELTVSTNVLLQSGRPINCIGVDTDVDGQFHYDASYFYCNGQPANRGSVGRTGVRFDLDLGVNYAPRWAPGLTIQAQVFNLFNLSADLSRDETGEFTAEVDDEGNILSTAPYSSYQSIYSYQPPRSFMLSAQYKFNFAQ